MDEHLQHDPRTKQQIKDAVYHFVYSPILKHFQERLSLIVAKNCTLIGNSDLTFIYKGETYSTSSGNTGRTLNRLAKPMIPFMEEYLKDIRQLNNYELPYVLGFIGQVLNSSNHLHDYLLLLPPSVHRPIESMIASCPCKSVRLTPESITEFQNKNKVSIDLMKQRMVTNLLI